MRTTAIAAALLLEKPVDPVPAEVLILAATPAQLRIGEQNMADLGIAPTEQISAATQQIIEGLAQKNIHTRAYSPTEEGVEKLTADDCPVMYYDSGLGYKHAVAALARTAEKASKPRN